MTISDLLINFIFSFAVTAGFSIFFNAPKKSLIPCGIVGGIGWCAYILMSKSSYFSNVFSMVIASAVISLLSEILARKLKYPSINFIIPGILPLVPGLGLYNTMYSLVQKDYALAVSTGKEWKTCHGTGSNVYRRTVCFHGTGVFAGIHTDKWAFQ